MCREAGEKYSKSVERAAGHRYNARSLTIQPETANECGHAQYKNTDRKSQRYLGNAPAELPGARGTKYAPGIDRAQSELHEHSGEGDVPSIKGFHGLLLG